MEYVYKSSDVEYTHFKAISLCGENSYLPGYSISESVVPVWFYCFTLCLKSSSCRSVNIWDNPGNVTCQLKSGMVDDCVYLQSSAGARYLHISLAFRVGIISSLICILE